MVGAYNVAVIVEDKDMEETNDGGNNDGGETNDGGGNDDGGAGETMSISGGSFQSADFDSQSSISSDGLDELIDNTTQEVKDGITEFDSIMDDEGGHKKRGREKHATVKKKRKGKKNKAAGSKPKAK